MEKERRELIEKAKKILRAPEKPGGGEETAESKFFQVALEHEHDAHDRHCLDEE